MNFGFNSPYYLRYISLFAIWSVFIPSHPISSNPPTTENNQQKREIILAPDENVNIFDNNIWTKHNPIENTCLT